MDEGHLVDRLEALTALHHDLRTVLITNRFYAKSLSLHKIIDYCDELDEISRLLALGGEAKRIYVSEWFSVSLDEWRSQLRQSWNDELLQRWFDIPNELQSLRIWEDWTRTYWLKVIESLEWWWAAGPAQLESVEWRSSPKYVELIAQGSGKFIGVREVEVRKAKREFWILDVRSGAASILSDALAAELLVAQLTAQQGGGWMAVQVLGEGQIAIQLSIPRADTAPWPAEGEAVLPVNVTRQVLDYVLHLAIDSIVKVGNRLKRVLPKEIHQLETFVGEGEIGQQIGELQKGLDQLSLLLSAFDDWLTYWWTDQPVTTVNVAERIQKLAVNKLEWAIHRQGHCRVRGQLHKLDYVLREFLDGAIVLLGGEAAGRGLEVVAKQDEVWITMTSGKQPVTAVPFEQAPFSRGGQEVPGVIFLSPYSSSRLLVTDVAMPLIAGEILLRELGGWVDVQNTLGLKSYVRLHLPRKLDERPST